MSISSLHWRVASVLLGAGAAATAVLLLAMPAGASTGPAEISPEQAGYTATGAQFQEVDATVYLRIPAQYSGEVRRYSLSVQLWSSDRVAVVGVTASTSGSRYTPYATIYDRSTHAVIASDPNAEICDEHHNCTSTIGSFAARDTVILKLIYFPKSGALAYVVGDSNTRLTFLSEPLYPVGPAESFTQARIGTEFGSDLWTAPSSYTPPTNPMMIAAYNNVALTSYSGHTATLWSWWVHHHLRAETGQQSGSDRVAVPTYLTSGGASFQTWFVPQSGQRRTPTVPAFNSTFYATVATIIPVLFLAIGVQGDTYKDIIRAATKLLPVVRGSARGLAPVLLAVAVVPAAGIGGEIVAVLVLAWGHADFRTYRLILLVLILLIVVVALAPMVDFGRFAIEALRSKPAAAAADRPATAADRAAATADRAAAAADRAAAAADRAAAAADRAAAAADPAAADSPGNVGVDGEDTRPGPGV